MIRKITKAGVVGSGTMGGGIAALLAGAGIQTVLLDILPPDLTEAEKKDPAARNRIASSGLDRAIFSQPPLFMHVSDAARIVVGNLEDHLDTLSTCDWIVEAAVENVKIKQALFKRVETVRRADAIVSTNTSGIPLKTLCAGLGPDFRSHFLGTHFFNPVRYMRLLEIIPGEDTLPEILNFMSDFCETRLGKGVVRAKDTPNFIANRIGVHGMITAMQRMREAGLTVAQVDALFGPPLGRPKTAVFRTADLVGIDVLGHVARNTHALVTGDPDRESFVLPEFVDRMIEKDLLGNKTQSGFYKTEITPEFKKVIKAIDPDTLEYAEFIPPDFPCLARAAQAKTLSERIQAILYGQDPGSRFAWKVVAGGLIYAADRIPEIADTLVDIDTAMKWGFNFELGPFELWDAIGLQPSVEKMRADGFPVPDKITEMIATGHTRFYTRQNGRCCYYDFSKKTYAETPLDAKIVSLAMLRSAGKVIRSCPSASLLDLGDGVFCCEFHTKMNAINREIVDFLSRGLEVVQESGIGLVIGNQAGGMPGAFSAGGDLRYMASLATEGKFSEMGEFLESAQRLIQCARYAPFPVVAAPYGMTLGGGCEVCLAADAVVAHAELYMGLVEIGVGLLPAGGGCLNLWKKFIQSIPPAITDYDRSKFFLPVFMSIALAKVSTSAADARANGFLNAADRIVFNRDHLIGEAKKTVLRMAEAGYAPPIKGKIPVMGRAARGLVETQIYNLREGRFISEYDGFLARTIARVISGGEVRENSSVDEDVILKLEREAFVDLWREEKTRARVEHMLKTGKPLRN